MSAGKQLVGLGSHVTLGYVDWFNHRRLHGEILNGPGYTTPAAFEADHYRQPNTAAEAATQ